MAAKSSIKSTIINTLIITVALVFCLSVLFVVLALEFDKGDKQTNHGKDTKRLLREWVSTGEKRGRPNRNASSLPGFPDSIPGYNQVAESVGPQISSRTYLPIDGASVVDSLTASIQLYGADTEAAEAVYQLRYSYIYDHRLIWMRMQGTKTFYGDDHIGYAVIAWSEGNQMVKILAKVKTGNPAGALLGPLIDVAKDF